MTDAGRPLLPALDVDEWGTDEYAAVGVLFGMPTDEVPRAGPDTRGTR